ncbi:MAG: FkbM family methyltransferase [Myxococcota bacterium]
MSNTTFVRQGPGHFVLTLNGQAHSLTFPAEGNLESIVIKTLGGQEYVPLHLPGWKPELIVDVGANVGATSIFFALCFPDAKIESFEPSESTFSHLRSNTSWLPNIRIHPVGLFNRDAEVPLYAGVTQCAQASMSRSVETRVEPSEVIRLVSARQAIPEPTGPAILKIDTEGCEVPILHDLGERVQAFDVVYVEWHSERDRRQIDRLLGTAFSVWKTTASGVHRGTAAYIHQRVIDAHPRLGILEIPAVVVEPALAHTG